MTFGKGGFLCLLFGMAFFAGKPIVQMLANGASGHSLTVTGHLVKSDLPTFAAGFLCLLFHHFGLRELVCDISHKEHFEMQAEQGEHGHFGDPARCFSSACFSVMAFQFSVWICCIRSLMRARVLSCKPSLSEVPLRILLQRLVQALLFFSSSLPPFFLDGALYAAPTFDRSMKASKSALSKRRRFPKVTDGTFLPQAIVRTNQMVAPKYSAAARTFNSRGVTGAAAVTGFFFVAVVIAGLLQGQPGVTPRLLLNRFIGLFFAGVF
jgi:hypothetical protein